MVTSALRSAQVIDYADGMFLADMIKLYKPAKKIYESLIEFVNSDGGADGRLTGTTVTPDRVWLVSG